MRLGLGLGFSKVFSSGAVIVPPSASFDFTSTPYASGLVDMTAQTFTYQNGLGPVWVGLKAQ